MQNDFDRLLFFEHARKTAEDAYAQDPLDADVCFSISCFIYWIYLFFLFFCSQFSIIDREVIKFGTLEGPKWF